MATSTKHLPNLRFAFRQTIPVMLGYVFLGIAFGLMLNDAGYSFVWAVFASIVIYAGSMQFVLVTLLGGGAGLLYAAMMTLFVNGRHIFYGLSLVEKYQNMGKSYPYMIFSLTDETYSLQCQLKVPEHLNEKRVMLLVSLLDQCYWVVGSLLGGLVGRFIIFDSTGIEFSMTALFTAIVVEKWRKKSNRLPVLIGSGCSLFFLFLLGADRFIMPALALSVAVLLYKKQGLRKNEEASTKEVKND